jgi:endoribonuclease LACTB2
VATLAVAEAVDAGVWRLPLAARTLPPFDHTNAYVLASQGVSLVVDPGADGRDAAAAITRAVTRAGSRSPKGIVLTHTHRDHVEGVPRLLATWPETRVYVHPLELAQLPEAWRAIGLSPGRRLTLGDEIVEAVATPGHSPGHLALWLARPRVLLAGDLVAGEGSVWVGLPHGDVAAYLASLARAAALAPLVIAPAHGPVRRDGAAVLHEARAHRLGREAAIVAALRAGPLELVSLRERVYPELPEAVVDLAERSLLAHLRKLMDERRVMHVGEDVRGPFVLTPGASAEPRA